MHACAFWGAREAERATFVEPPESSFVMRYDLWPNDSIQDERSFMLEEPSSIVFPPMATATGSATRPITTRTSRDLRTPGARTRQDSSPR